MKKKTNFSILILTIVLCLSSCYKDNKEAMYPATQLCDSTAVTWGGNIQSIVNNSCALSGCHDAGTAVGGYDLSNFSGVKKMVVNNRFLDVIESGTMPKGASKLDDCNIGKIRSWINSGALEN